MNKKFMGGQEGPMTLTMTVNTQWHKLHNESYILLERAIKEV